MVDDALNFRLGKTIDDGVFALRDMDYMAYDMRSSFHPWLVEKCTHYVLPEMIMAQLDKLFGASSVAYSLVIMK
jgi:hypothetical protein